MEHVSHYRDFVMGTRMEGPCTEDSKVHSGRLWKWSISSVRFHTGNLRHIARDGWASMFIGPEPVLDIFFSYV
jgi:hypothetical protein